MIDHIEVTLVRRKGDVSRTRTFNMSSGCSVRLALRIFERELDAISKDELPPLAVIEGLPNGES